jgi:hypothetical protein
MLTSSKVYFRIVNISRDKKTFSIIEELVYYKEIILIIYYILGKLQIHEQKLINYKETIGFQIFQ